MTRQMPAKLELASIQRTIRDLWEELDGKVGYSAGGKQIVNAKPATTASGLVTLSQLSQTLNDLGLGPGGLLQQKAIDPLEYLFPHTAIYMDHGGVDQDCAIDGGVLLFDTLLDTPADVYDTGAFDVSTPGQIVCARAGKYLLRVEAMIVSTISTGLIVLNSPTLGQLYDFAQLGQTTRLSWTTVEVLEEGHTISVDAGGGTDYVYPQGVSRNRVILMDLTRSV